MSASFLSHTSSWERGVQLWDDEVSGKGGCAIHYRRWKGVDKSPYQPCLLPTELREQSKGEIHQPPQMGHDSEITLPLYWALYIPYTSFNIVLELSPTSTQTRLVDTITQDAKTSSENSTSSRKYTQVCEHSAWENLEFTLDILELLLMCTSKCANVKWIQTRMPLLDRDNKDTTEDKAQREPAEVHRQIRWRHSTWSASQLQTNRGLRGFISSHCFSQGKTVNYVVWHGNTELMIKYCPQYGKCVYLSLASRPKPVTGQCLYWKIQQNPGLHWIQLYFLCPMPTILKILLSTVSAHGKYSVIKVMAWLWLCQINFSSANTG